MGHGGKQRDPGERDRRPNEDIPRPQCFLLCFRARRPHSSTDRPRRTLRSVAATSSAVVSTSSCTTSNSASRSARRASADLDALDRKSTRLNSSHVRISYAVFCLKKKKQN